MADIALVGNPNCGKTTLFNSLTGSNQYVGNWAGVTVEKKSGKTKDGRYNIVDLPGIYSLSPYSMEEKISRDFVLKEKPDAIINIIDGTNFERNLYLTVQLVELGIPMVLVVNMMDDVAAKGGSIDTCYLSKLLGMPVVPISARRGENLDSVLEQLSVVISRNIFPPEINFDIKTQNAINSVFSVIYKDGTDIPYSFYSSKLIEGDADIIASLDLTDEQSGELKTIIQDYEATSRYGDCESMLADARYRFIEDVSAKCVNKGVSDDKPTLSDKIDSVVTNRFLALPIFLGVMLIIFSLTFGPVGTYLSDLISKLFEEVITPAVDKGLTKADAPQWTFGLLIDGVINGVGGVLTFLPQISILFLCLSLLEDSGYMARAAFITDRFLRKLGLSGKSFIPMLMGFGCTTPAVMATRTQENINERRMTILLIPFMSCGAKLPIYALFAGLFFASHQSLVVLSMYAIGFATAIIIGLILKKTLFKQNMAPFIMELPTYRMPVFKNVVKNTWEKCRGFIVKAGTIIFAMSIVIWLLQSFTTSFRYTTDSSDSIFAAIGKVIAPVLSPLGFGNWKSAVALLSGLVAKEAVVSTMLVLYSASDTTALTGMLSGVFTPLSAFSFMVFCLLYIPCISAFVTIKREMGSMKWAAVSAVIQLVAAYTVSLLVYQIGSLFV